MGNYAKNLSLKSLQLSDNILVKKQAEERL